ncbi:O-antigen ligase family protein [Alcaligenaceae bacterium]|nr:O-antigen ligase family protein [Alcaligenaceae bacterium]
MGGYSAAGIAIWQLYGLGWSDVDGLTNGVRFGAISTMLGILCVAGLLWARKEVVTDVWRWRLALGVGALSAWYGSLMSGTRGAWVALPVVFILFCLALFSKRNLYKGTALCAALLIAVSAWIAVTPENPVKTGYRNAVNDVGDYFERGIVTGSIGGRFAVWDAAVMNIPEKPLLGWGVKEYRQHLERQVSDGLLDPYVLQLSHTHNMYLEAAVYKGLVGLLTVLALLVFPFYYFGLRLRSPCMNVRIFAVSGTSLIAVFSILGLSHIGLYRNDILLFFLVSLMTLWACMRAEEYSL